MAFASFGDHDSIDSDNYSTIRCASADGTFRRADVGDSSGRNFPAWNLSITQLFRDDSCIHNRVSADRRGERMATFVADCRATGATDCDSNSVILCGLSDAGLSLAIIAAATADSIDIADWIDPRDDEIDPRDDEIRRN